MNVDNHNKLYVCVSQISCKPLDNKPFKKTTKTNKTNPLTKKNFLC